jgi:hypothetical protein
LDVSEFKRLKSELFEGPPEKLRRVIESHRALEATPVEREFDEKWAKEIRERVLKGLAVSFFWAVADLPLDGKIMRLRMNGNHSSWALNELLKDGELPHSLAIHLDTYSVSDKDGAVLLFRQFDNRKSSRTKEDISGAYQCFHETIRGCKRAVAKLAVEGTAWYRREIQGIAVPSGDELYELFNQSQLHPFILMADMVIDSKSNELKRVPVAAAMYGTWLDDGRKATDFWKLVALGSKRSVTDAASDLDDELVRIKTEKDGKEKVRAGDLYAKCAKAWTAFLDGSRVANFKVNTKAKGLPVIAA